MSDPNPVTAAELERIIAAYQRGAMHEVVARVTVLPLERRRGNETALLAGALALHALGRNAEATDWLQQLVQLRPAVPEYWNNLAITARAAEQLELAERALRAALALAPTDAQLHHHLGLLEAQRQRWPQARKHQFDALHLAPDFIEARLQGALACHVCGDVPGEDHLLRDVEHWPPQPAEQALTLATILAARGAQAAAFDVLARALLPSDAHAAAPLQWRIAAQRASLHERANRLDRAQAELAALAATPLPPDQRQARHDVAHVRAVLAGRHGNHAAAAQQWQALLDEAEGADVRAAAAFGLAAALDKLGDAARAWAALTLAHAQQMRTLRHVVPQLLADDAQSLPMVRHRVTRADIARWTATPTCDAADPVFVVGFPRSGTTLLEQMIDAHPAFRSMDERPFVYDLIERMDAAGQRYPEALGDLHAEEIRRLRAIYFERVASVLPDRGTARLVDKNPLNMLALPMIVRLFPRAHIVLCLRHPCDVLLSCSMLPFRSPGFMTLCSSLPRLARGFVQAFEQWFAHVEVFAPQVLTWRYEAVVEQFDAQVAQLGEFLGVDDRAPMTQFAAHARAKTFISTPSYAQVTQGIHRRAVGRWHAYRDAFAPVLPILRPMLDRLGYDA